MGYVEGLNDERTPLADFFSISLKEVDHNPQMHPIILNRVADLWHVVQLLSPIDFETGSVVRQYIPSEPDTNARERVGKGGDRLRWGSTVAALVPAMRDVHEGGQLEHRCAVPPTI